MKPLLTLFLLVFSLETDAATYFRLVETNGNAYLGNLTVTNTGTFGSINVLTNISADTFNVGTFYATNIPSLSVQGQIAADTLKSTNGISSSGGVYSLPSYTVGTLPAASAGNMAYCSDALTAWGTGEVVIYNGSNWILPASKVVASSTVRNFILESLRVGAVYNTPLTWSSMAARSAGATLGPNPFGGASYTSGGYTTSAMTTYGPAIYSETPSAAGGGTYACMYGEPTVVTPAGETRWMSAAVSPSALCSVSEPYWLLFGWGRNNTATNYPSDGVFLLYDMTQWAHVDAHTNNWLAVTTGTTQTVADTGIAVASSTTTPIRAGILWTSTDATFFLNGTAVVTNSTTLPGAGITMWPMLKLVKLSGSATRDNYMWDAYRIERHATGRTFYP